LRFEIRSSSLTHSCVRVQVPIRPPADFNCKSEMRESGTPRRAVSSNLHGSGGKGRCVNLDGLVGRHEHEADVNAVRVFELDGVLRDRLL